MISILYGLDDDKKASIFKLLFLASATGISVIGGLSFALTRVSRKQAGKLLSHEAQLHSEGTRLAVRALAYASFGTVGVFALASVITWKLLAASDMKHFGERCKAVFPIKFEVRKTNDSEPDFKTVRELVEYVAKQP